MSKQIFVGGDTHETLPIAAGTTYINLINPGNQTFNTTLNRRQIPFPCAGKLKNFRVILSAAPGAGNTREVNIQNGSTKVITLSFGAADTDLSDTATEATIAVKDPIVVSIVSTGTPTVCTMQFSAEFVGDVSAQSAYGGGGSSNPSQSVQNWCSLLCGPGNTWGTTEGNVVHVAPMNGTITAFYVKLSASITTGSQLYQIYKNGSAETSSNVTISSGSTGEATGLTIDVAPGDTFSLSATPTSTPTNARVGVGIAITADVAGESMLVGASTDDLNVGSVEYNNGTCPAIASVFSATETEFQGLVGPTGFDLTFMYVRLGGAPGSGKSFTLRPRKSAADSASLAVTVADAATTGSNTNTESYANGNLLALKVTPSGTPTTSPVTQWAFVQTITEAAPANTHPGYTSNAGWF